MGRLQMSVISDFLQIHSLRAQALLAVLFIALLFRSLRKLEGESKFKLREADRLASKPRSGTDTLAEARIRKNSPLLLTGIVLDGAPHEILGVSENASPSEIQSAYRELMKRFHPDRVGRQGTREWQDAQGIAARITEAKETLISRGKR